MSRFAAFVRTLGILALLILPAGAKPPVVAITNVTRDASGITLRWQASSPGLQFTVESRESLAGGTWEAVPGISWPAQTNAAADPRPIAAARFYRVVHEPVPGQRGRLISVDDSQPPLNRTLIQFLFDQQGYPITADKDVRFYKLIYETVDAQGLQTVASGALALPMGVNTPLPLTSYQHGTVVVREEVPSRLNTEGFIGVAFATAGYAAALPDLLGLGDSPGFHPYHHAKSEATSVVDLLRAARSFCADRGIVLSDKLFLTGYSYGGHATLAALREIEAQHAAEFTVTACAAGAGAYDLSGTTLNRVLEGTPVPNPYYYPYLLAAYVDVYGIADSLADLLAPTWRTTIPPLFNGTTSSDVINAALPASPLEAFAPDLVAALNSPADHPLRAALRDNDLYDWTPRAPLRLYHCSGDQDVAPMNSRVAYEHFQARGATQVQLIDPSAGADHTGCVKPTLLEVKAWFDSLR